ncbi:hypothetical protein ACQP1G_20785 [Nocardia sp. CA-107356]|uniref:hypothetical protein n=1 Tax=Nocardia sp. CA-107356 TaxID=3239972 RepID=UPI003D8C42F0
MELLAELADENAAWRAAASDYSHLPCDLVVIQWRRTDEYCANLTGKDLHDLAVALGKPVAEIVEDDVVERLGEFLDSGEDPNSNFHTGNTERTPLMVHFAPGATPVDDDAPDVDQ